MKKVKTAKQAYTSNSKKGMGDYYGSGLKAPIGRSRSDLIGKPIPSRKRKVPPTKLG